MSIFRAYDIRGVYPVEIHAEIVRKIAYCMVKHTGAKTVAVGYDMRESRKELFQATCEGVWSAGADVVNVGLVSTPLFYFSVIHYGEHDAGIMVTASHNPAEYNGMKMLYGDGAPIGRGSGMEEIEQMVGEMANGILNRVQSLRRTRSGDDSIEGNIREIDVLSAYVDVLCEKVNVQNITPLRVVVDAGNGMAGYVAPKIFERLPVRMTPMYFELDGSFPNHEANPIKEENTVAMRDMVLKTHADLGIAYDGDADRIAFCDERGEMIPGGMTTALLALSLLKSESDALILSDLRSSKAVEEVVLEAGGRFEMTPVGHSLIKKQMREQDALFAGELSGHFYFKEFAYLDIADYAMLLMLQLLSAEKRPLSKIISEMYSYAHSGEINFEVVDKNGVLKRLVEEYKDVAQKMYDFDGVMFEFGDWRFGVRASNTEPVLRLNLEAKNEVLMNDKVREINEIITSYE